MYENVKQDFNAFSTQFEWRVPYMYVDIKDKVTIGVGNLIDPLPHALGLPFVFKSDASTPASEDDITADWNAVKSDPNLAKRGYKACDPLTRLMLTDDAIDELVASKAAEFEGTLKQTSEFSGYDEWPADAQLGLLSMAWAMGPAFGPGWPAFRTACGEGDWDTAAANCGMNESGNPGLVPRNAANRALFRTATYMVSQSADPSVLGYTVSGSRPVVRLGMSNEHVSYLQDRLNTLGYTVDASGSFDDATDVVVRGFQGENGLAQDGIVGAQGWAALGTGVPSEYQW
jgi:hypothetical protein